jgi:hypothetical protein
MRSLAVQAVDGAPEEAIQPVLLLRVDRRRLCPTLLGQVVMSSVAHRRCNLGRALLCLVLLCLLDLRLRSLAATLLLWASRTELERWTGKQLTREIPQVAVIGLGSTQVTAIAVVSGNAIALAGQTLSSGQVATIKGQTVSNAGNALVIGPSAVQFSRPDSSASDPIYQFVIAAGSDTLVATSLANGAVGIKGGAIQAGETTVIAGETVVDASTGLVVNGQTVHYTPVPSFGVVSPSNPQVFSGAMFSGSGGNAATATLSVGTVHYEGQTSTPGQVVTISGQTVSDATSALVVDGQTVPFFTIPIEQTSSENDIVITGSGISPFTAIQTDGSVVLADHTLTPGQVETIDGQTISDDSSVLVVNGQTVPFSALLSSTDVVESGAVISASGGSSITVQETAGIAVFQGETLTPGEVTTIDGKTVSYASTGLVVNGKTAPFSALSTPATTAASGAVLPIGSQVVTASELSDGNLVVDGTTLSVGGPAVTVSGQVISDGPSGLVDGTKTVPLSSPGSSTTAPAPGSTSSHKGDASSSRSHGWLLLLPAALACIAWCWET